MADAGIRSQLMDVGVNAGSARGGNCRDHLARVGPASRRALRAGALAALIAASLPHAAHPAAADPDEGQRAYAAGRYSEARQLWTPQAEAGDKRARLGLASLYDLGQGVKRDAATAYHWYRRAAEAGIAAAEFNVAVMRDTGDGVARDAADAALWYARAAAHGNRRAQYNLGQLYAAGDGVPRNEAEAEAWFRDAAAALPAAVEKLAAMRRGVHASPSASTTEDGAPLAAQPVAPADGSTVPALAGEPPDAADAVELVWVAPAQAVPVRFFVQLLALDAAGTHEVFGAYLDETATLAPLERVPGRYAWRVYAVARDLRHYAASEWQRFQVGALEP